MGGLESPGGLELVEVGRSYGGLAVLVAGRFGALCPVRWWRGLG